MENPCYINLEQARKVLAGIGVKLTERQMRRAAEKDARGRRKLPFFRDPVEGTLKIEKGALMKIYNDLQADAKQRIRD